MIHSRFIEELKSYGIEAITLGNPAYSQINGTQKQIIPFVGMWDTLMGTGYKVLGDPDIHFCGHGSPHSPIQSLHAMQLLEKMRVLDDRALRLCCATMAPEPSLCAQNMLEKDYFLNPEISEEVRGSRSFGANYMEILGRFNAAGAWIGTPGIHISKANPSPSRSLCGTSAAEPVRPNAKSFFNSIGQIFSHIKPKAAYKAAH